MNNDELPMRAETASAYVDGELDAAEQSAAAADPETMAMADSFVRIRAALADVAPVADDLRSAALTAALAEFDARDSAMPVAAGAVAAVTPLKARRVRTYRLLTGVAAALVVGVVAVAALNSTGDDTQSFSAIEASVPAATAESAEQPSLKVADTETAADTAAGQPAAGSAADSAATVVPAVDSQDALVQYAAGNGEVGGTTSAAPLATAAAAAVAATAAPAETDAAPVPPAAAPAVASYQTPSCLPSNDTILGPVTVRGIPALVVRDPSTGVVQAIDAADCTVYFSANGP
jgi:negative regulator of sigma E activity